MKKSLGLILLLTASGLAKGTEAAARSIPTLIEKLQTPLIRGVAITLAGISLSGGIVLYLWDRKLRKPVKMQFKTLIEEGYYQQALEQFKEKIFTDPDLIQEISDHFTQLQQSDNQSLEIYKKAYEINRAGKDTLMLLAQAEAKEGKQDAHSIELYQSAIALGIDSPIILETLSDYYYRQRLWKEAAHYYRMLTDSGESSPEIYVKLAKCYLQLNQNDETIIPIYETALATEPSNQALTLALATSYSQLGRQDAPACLAYEQALKIKPDLILVRLTLCRALLAQKKLSACIEHCQYFIHKGIIDDDVSELLGGVYLQTGQWQQAETVFRRLSSHDKDLACSLPGLAQSLAEQNRNDAEAIAIYEKALKLKPVIIPVLKRMFPIYCQQENIDAILESGFILVQDKACNAGQMAAALEKVILKLSATPEIHLLQGWIYARTNQPEYALTCLRRALETNPSKEMMEYVIEALNYLITQNPKNRELLKERAELKIKTGTPKEALPDYEMIFREEGKDSPILKDLLNTYRLLLNENDDLELRYRLGNTLESLGRYQDAVLEFQQSAKEENLKISSRIHMARCFLSLKKTDIALSQLEGLDATTEILSVYYDIAQQYLESARTDKAYILLEKIHSVKDDFKDVGLLLSQTRMHLQEEKLHQTRPVAKPSDKPSRRFQIIGEIARGGMGVVYCAMDTLLNEMVALKMLPREFNQEEQAVERFIREVRATRKLNHPHIVRIYDIGDEDGQLFISMEYINGKTLRQIQKEKGPFSEKELWPMMKQVCQALATAHAQEVIHRDIKPANIMLDSSHHIKVMDFGIAKLPNAERLTQTSDFLGTPLYMSPEQCQGFPVDQRSDIYSLGVTLFELLTGSLPFTEGNIAYHHIRTPPPAPAGLSPLGQQIILKCLAKDPAERYQSADELFVDIEKACSA
jgi:tetratricopeptide (TPR) repeat protein